MDSGSQGSFKKRFRNRVLIPGVVVLLATAILCGGALVAAGRGTDNISLGAQQMEVWRTVSNGLDNLSLAQESIGLCEECIRRADSPVPESAWFDKNIGFPLFDLYGVQETYILDGKNRPVYASVQRRPASPAAYERVAPSVDYFVKLARGETKRPMGRGNLNERLPGSPPEPLVFPPAPGFSKVPVTVLPTVRTTSDVIHATDLVQIGDQTAFVSVMRMAQAPEADHRRTASAPLLISLYHLDDKFLAAVAKQNYLLDPRIVKAGRPAAGETSTPLMSSDRVPLATFFWKPQLGGATLVDAMLPPAAGMFAVVALLVLLMSLKMRRLMKQDDDRLQDLERTHLELKAKEAQAYHLAYHDALTGLPNRALFNEHAEQALLRARHGERMAVLLLDLDRFKNVNDRFGHLAGDALIQEVATRLSQLIDRKDAVARLGGDEFAILLEGEELASLETTLDRILAEVRHPYEVFGNYAHVGVSIGIALAPEGGTDRTELMRKADIALYRAKEDGRDCYCFFTESMDETVQLRTTLEADLRRAMATGDGLCIHYQPLVDSARRDVTGLEALLRWHHPTRGWVPPHLFVPVAEETGLISEIGDWVLSEACKVARDWPDLTVAVNLSPLQFCDEAFAERVCAIVRESGVSASQIELEVTEGVLLDQNESVREALRRLRTEGFRIALDDFGTGYSSLSYLRDFEVDRIKIDRSFIQNLGQTLDAGSIVTAVVTLGHAMGLEVTAEGVETADQEKFLRAAGCNVLQGFLFSRAVPANRLRGSLGGARKEAAADRTKAA